MSKLEVGKVAPSNSGISQSRIPEVPQLDQSARALRGIGDVTNGIGEALAGFLRKRDTIGIVKAESGILASTDAEVAKLDPLAKEYPKQVEEVYTRAKATAQENANLYTREGREELDARLTRIQQHGVVQAQEKQRISVEKEAIRTYDQASNEVFAKVRRDPTAAATYTAGFQADAAKLTEGLRPDTRRAVDEKYRDNIVSAQALGYADRGNYAAAKQVLDTNMGTLNPAQEQKARYEIRAIEEKARTDSARFAANVHADTAAKIEDWKYSNDPTAPPPVTRADIEEMRPQFANNPAGYLSLVTLLDGAIYQRERAQQTTREALQNAETRSIRNQGEADLAFNNQYGLHGKKPSEVMTPELLTAAGTFAREQGYVPSVYKAQIENAGRSGGMGGNTPEEQTRLASATAAYDRINELAPNTKWGFADDKGSRVQLSSTIAKQEQISIAEAARRVLSMSPKSEAETTSRVKAYQDAFKQAHGSGQGQNATNWTNGQVLSQFSYTGQNIVGALVPGADRPPRVAPEVAEDYQKKLEQNFIKVPDWDVAKRTTDDWLKQNYSITNVGDRNEVTKYAPERYFDPVVSDRVNKYGMASQIVQDDISSILKAGNIVPGRNPYDPKLPGYRLYADDQTAKEADKWQASGPSPDGSSARVPVTYRIQVLDAFGMYQDVNGPRYRLPNAQEIIEGVSKFIVKETSDQREMMQPGAAAAARNKLTQDRLQRTPITMPDINLNLDKADTGVADPNAPKPVMNLEDALKRRAQLRGMTNPPTAKTPPY